MHDLRNRGPSFPRNALAGALLVLTAALPAAAGEPADGRLAPLLDGLGDHHFAITTDVPLAQRYFDQGLVLAYGFNHAEAERSFREAARRDPQCSMCWWGVAYVLGPNINAPMAAAAVPVAWEAIGKARALAGGASERERAFIHALATRYAPDPLAEHAPLERAYADAMREVARRYPDDSDASTLFAEALMDTMPWDYWQPDGSPRPAAAEAQAALDTVFARDPFHPGANHFQIHLVEKVHPERGLTAAARLERLVPGAGHLVHMPSHVYLNVGLYHQATEANLRAVASDRDYLTQCHAQGVYPVSYASHNHHFLWAAASLEGRGELAIGAAREMSQRLATHHAEFLRGPTGGTAQHFWVTPLFALVRFGQWDDILAEPEPPADLLYAGGVWHYARGLALIRKRRLEEAAAQLAALDAAIADPGLDGMTFWEMNELGDLLGVARHVLAGELAAARGEMEAAVRELRAGVEAEDALFYDDPADWHHPVREILGAVLLEAGRPAEAEAVYREDLARFPSNGWSLHGLWKSLEAQGRAREARVARRRFEVAWQYADVELVASRL